MLTADIQSMLLVPVLVLLMVERSGGILPGENLFFITMITHDLSASSFSLRKKGPEKQFPEVHLEILNRERLRISVYGLYTMYSEIYI